VSVFLDKVEKSSDSISLVGHMTGNSEGYEFSFLSGIESNSAVNWVILNSVKMKAAGKFKYSYSRYNLNPGIDYSFKVNLFSGTDSYTSNIITLKADVYKLTVDSISPKYGVIGDTAKIYGKNFGSMGLGYGFFGLADKMGGDIRDMWKYDSIEDKWLKLPDFPIQYQAFTLPFVVGNNGWFLLGSDIYTGVKLWKFSPFN
jgi:hypothetical protein